MKRRYQRSLFVVAVLAVAALTFLPATGWIIRRQFAMIGGSGIPGLTSSGAPGTSVAIGEAAVARQHPDDFGLQIAEAIDAGSGVTHNPGEGIANPVVRSLISLQPRFNDRPELEAHILRFLTLGDLKIGRAGDELLIQSPAAQADYLHREKQRPERLASKEAIQAALDAAQRGEQLDPGNGYFPTMRAVALFAARRDAEAITALDTAAADSEWNDFSSDEVRGRWRLKEETEGRMGAISQIAISASLLFPHYAVMRDMARLSIATAVSAELKGDKQQGIRIRRDVARIGAVMRAKSTYVIGSLVGIAITQISASRPGGEPLIARDPNANDQDRIVAERRAQYVSYLSESGHADEAAWYMAECSAGEKAKSIIHMSLSSDGELEGALRLEVFWAVGALLILASLWTLGLGGVASIAARSGRIRNGIALWPCLRSSGMACAVVLIGWLGSLCGIFTVGCVAWTVTGASVVGVTAAAAILLIAPLRRLLRGSNPRSVVKDVAVGATALLATVAVVTVLVSLGALCCSGFDRMFSSLGLLFSGMDQGALDSQQAFQDLMRRALEGAAVMTIPLLVALILAIRSRIVRVPASMGMVRGFRGTALPLAAGTLLLFCAVVIGTTHEESVVSSLAVTTITNECNYLAENTHQDWPGLVAPAPTISAPPQAR